MDGKQAEAALLALGGGVEWLAWADGEWSGTCETGEYHVEKQDRFAMPTAYGKYGVRYHDNDYWDDSCYDLLYDTAQEAKAACEHHHATGDWELEPNYATGEW